LRAQQDYPNSEVAQDGIARLASQILAP